MAGREGALAVEVYPGLLGLLSHRHEVMSRQVWSMVVLSLALHFLLLSLAAWLRLFTAVEKPLSSYQVSLVDLPMPAVTDTPLVRSQAKTELPRLPDPPQPVRRMPSDLPKTKPASPSSAQTHDPIQAPKAAQELPPKPLVPTPMPAAPTAKPSEPKAPPVSFTSPSRPSFNREFLRGIELPPAVPKLGGLDQVSASARKPASALYEQQASKEVQKLLGNLNVPESPVQSTTSQPSVPKEMPVSSVKPSSTRPVLSEELRKQLQDLQRPLQRQSEPAKPEPKNELAAVTKASLRNPATTIQAQGSGPGFNRYLLLVQRLISNGWVPPQVDPTIRSFQVIVKFRLYRDGSIKDVSIEQTSGNEYYDLAGKRAVLSARLPEFPAEMSEPYLDAHFSFTVGEQSG